MNTTHTAKRLTKAGSVPVYEYRGIRIVSSAGTYRGKGWMFYLADMDRVVSTLKYAKQVIDYAIDTENR